MVKILIALCLLIVGCTAEVKTSIGDCKQVRPKSMQEYTCTASAKGCFCTRDITGREWECDCVIGRSVEWKCNCQPKGGF